MSHLLRGALLRSTRQSHRKAAISAAGPNDDLAAIRREWSQEGVAERAGIDRRTYGNMERNETQRFSQTAISYVCEVLNLDPDEVIIEDDPGDLLVTRLLPPRKTKIGFRPARPWSAAGWEDSRVTITLDGIGFALPSDCAAEASVILHGLSVTMPHVAGGEVFSCRYLSTPIPGHTAPEVHADKNHIGVTGAFTAQTVTPAAPIAAQGWTCLSDGAHGLTWRKFMSTMADFQRNVLELPVTLHLSGGTAVSHNLRVAVAEMKTHMKIVEERGQALLRMTELEVLDL